jgi:SAM-dependent methyltransferase
MLDRAARPDHWDSRYRSVGAGSVSWFEAEPLQSVKLIDLVGATHRSSIIDVGGGASKFAQRLLETESQDVTVLDISEEALAIAKANVDRSDGATWIRADLLLWTPLRKWDIWHDRAVFHFLTEPADRAIYRSLLHNAVADGGTVVIATFAENGPTSCSGLPVERYSPEQLVDEIGEGFSVVDSGGFDHVTPTGSAQEFTWVALRADGPPRGSA